MKESFFMLSMIIPRPKAPGNDIDVYLELFVDELKFLLEQGVGTYVFFANETFSMRASLL